MNRPVPSIAIVGGGLAGLAAAVAAVERGFRVELFERAKRLGGRAGSFVDSTTGQNIDYCQHVAMGCCSQFLEVCRRTGLEECFGRQRELHFIGPNAARYDFAANRCLPAPLHLLPGLWRLKHLTASERCGVLRAMASLVFCAGRQPDRETVGDWLRRHGQSDRVLEQFWSVILVGALGETVDRASLAAARKVFLSGFLASRSASDLIVPQRPLSEIFGDRLGRWLEDHGVAVHTAAPIRRIEGNRQRAESLLLADGTRRSFDRVVVAVPWRNIRAIVSEELLAALPSLAQVDAIEPAAITAVHLWYDRPVVPLPNAVLVGRLSQWVFAGPEPGYCQAVISASHRLPKRTHDAWIADVCRDLESVWPEAQPSRLRRARVIAQPSAVFSVVPGLDPMRPSQRTPVENFALAGDWTATGWPATMEGAVRSGFQAVEQLATMM